jgi:hypothetical protein
VAPGWPPLWHSAGEPIPSQESARWHREGLGYAQYLSPDPQGAWAELVRFFSIRSELLAAELRRDLWLVYVVESDLADLSSFGHWSTCGLDPACAVGEHAPCQALGDELRAAGYRGVLAPSAALPEAINLTLFGERYEQVLLSGLERWSNPDPTVFLPCARVAGSAPPPAGLTMATCFRRMPHRGYRDFCVTQGIAPAGAWP